MQITVSDDGVGIPESVIQRVQEGTIESKRVGLNNVHQRIKLLYGKGLSISRLEPGTEFTFTIPMGQSL
ncbi:sensor protein [Vibrio sp. JCM 19236]|nr:sensor protein [Vibrio sp. JCM 19236]